MRRSLNSLLIGALLLSACQSNVVAVRKVALGGSAGSGTQGSDVTILHPSGTSSAGNTGTGASANPSASPAAIATPSVPMTNVTGKVMIDPMDVIAVGGANVIAVGGANVIAAGGANVIAVGGANIISFDPAASVIAAGGANVIAAGGANVIAAGGANVIAAGGANVIAAGGANYRLFDIGAGTGATASGTAQVVDPASLTPGMMLAAQGMVVVPLSLTTHQVLGTAVKSDATGGYTVSVPQSEKDNVWLLAAVPGKSASDPVLQNPTFRYSLYAAPQASAPALDDDSALLSQYVRDAIHARVKDALFAPGGMAELTDAVQNHWGVPAAMSGPIIDAFQQLTNETSKDYPSPLPANEQDALVDALMDNVLAKINGLGQIQLSLPFIVSKDNVADFGTDKYLDGTAWTILKDILSFMRTQADHKLGDPSVQAQYEAMGWNTTHASVPNAATLGQLSLQHYLNNNRVVLTGHDPSDTTDAFSGLQAEFFVPIQADHRNMTLTTPGGGTVTENVGQGDLIEACVETMLFVQIIPALQAQVSELKQVIDTFDQQWKQSNVVHL